MLFVCTGNSARSQMAEALLGRLAGRAVEVASAGTFPKGVNPYTIRVLAERGIDWAAARSTPLDEYLDDEWDWVVTVCDRAREACPVFPGARATDHWDLDDPAEVEGSDEDRLAAFRRTADEIEGRLAAFAQHALPGA